MSPAECRDAFRLELTHCRTLRQYAIDHITDPDVRSLTFESSLSRAFRAYENFVENTFIAYMTGESTVSGAQVQRFVAPPSSEHARRMLLPGNAKYLDWADPSTVVYRGKYFLHEDGPLPTAVTQAWNTIDWMRKVRNHIAHNSTESMLQYRKVVAVIMMVDDPAPARPGDLLQSRPHRGPFNGREVLAALLSNTESFVDSAVS
jgi:hypothetical protein